MPDTHRPPNTFKRAIEQAPAVVKRTIYTCGIAVGIASVILCAATVVRINVEPYPLKEDPTLLAMFHAAAGGVVYGYISACTFLFIMRPSRITWLSISVAVPLSLLMYAVGNTTSFREWSELNGVALLWTIVVPSCIVALWWAPSVRTYARQRGAPPGDASPSQSTPSPKA